MVLAQRPSLAHARARAQVPCGLVVTYNLTTTPLSNTSPVWTVRVRPPAVARESERSDGCALRGLPHDRARRARTQGINSGHNQDPRRVRLPPLRATTPPPKCITATEPASRSPAAAGSRTRNVWASTVRERSDNRRLSTPAAVASSDTLAHQPLESRPSVWSARSTAFSLR